MNLIATVGGFLVKKLGKDLALAILFASSKLLLFTMVSAFVATLLAFLNTVYGITQNIIDNVESMAQGEFLSSGGSVNECVPILFGAVSENLGLIDAINLVGPTLLLVYYTYFNVIMLGYSIKLYRFINNSITEFAVVVK